MEGLEVVFNKLVRFNSLCWACFNSSRLDKGGNEGKGGSGSSQCFLKNDFVVKGLILVVPHN